MPVCQKYMQCIIENGKSRSPPPSLLLVICEDVTTSVAYPWDHPWLLNLKVTIPYKTMYHDNTIALRAIHRYVSTIKRVLLRRLFLVLCLVVNLNSREENKVYYKRFYKRSLEALDCMWCDWRANYSYFSLLFLSTNTACVALFARYSPWVCTGECRPCLLIASLRKSAWHNDTDRHTPRDP